MARTTINQLKQRRGVGATLTTLQRAASALHLDITGSSSVPRADPRDGCDGVPPIDSIARPSRGRRHSGSFAVVHKVS